MKNTSIVLSVFLALLVASPSVGLSQTRQKSKTEKAGEKAARSWEKTKQATSSAVKKGTQKASEFRKGFKNESAKIKKEKEVQRRQNPSSKQSKPKTTKPFWKKK